MGQSKSKFKIKIKYLHKPIMFKTFHVVSKYVELYFGIMKIKYFYYTKGICILRVPAMQ